MAKKIVNVGTVANDGTGDKLRDAFVKVKENFDELYNRAIFNANAIQALPIFDSNEDASVLPDYTPFRTTSGMIRYKTPTSTDPLIWNDLQNWNDSLTWND